MARLIPRRLAPEEQATLVEHLSELRHRLVVSLISLIPAFALAYAYHAWLIERLKDLAPEGTKLVTLSVTEPFTTSLKLSFYVALAIMLPFLLWQIWSFLAPAVDAKVQRSISVFVVLATLLFALGVAFCFFVILPKALTFLVNYDADQYNDGEGQIRASYYLSFVTLTMFATGLAFLMPIFILALVRIRVISAATLRKNRRYGILIMVSFAILLPTVDPVSLALEIVPLLILFELSIWLSGIMERRWERAREASSDP